jgi:hypothetical protein
MNDQKAKRLAIVDGRWVGFVVGHGSIGNDVVTIEDALEIVTVLIPQQTPQGIASIRLWTVHPIATTMGPKLLSVRYSVILFADTDLDEQERKLLESNIKNCLDNVRQTKAHLTSGLILPRG